MLVHGNCRRQLEVCDVTPNLGYSDAGNPDNPCIVLLHSIATNADMWRHQIEALAADYRVVALDLPGHGRSACLAEAKPIMQDYAWSVLDTLDHLGVEKCAVAGLSLGSMIAQQVAVLAPQRVWGLILSNGVAYVPEPVKAAWKDRIETARELGMESQVSGTVERWFTEEFRKENPAAIADIAGMIKGTSVAGYAAAAHAIMAMDNRSILSKIAAPTLILAGEQDLAAPLAGVKAIAENVEGASFATLAASHLMNVELSDSYTELMDGFFKQCVEHIGGI